MTIDLTTWGLWLGRRRTPVEPATVGPPGVPVGQGDTGSLVVWPAPSRQAASHVAVFAGSGAGKSVMVAAAVVAEATATPAPGQPPPALFVVDPKGDLADHVLMALAATAPERLADVHYLDPFAVRGGFAFNLNHLELGATPLDIRAMQLANLVAEVSTATGSQRHLGVGARQVDLLTNVLLGALGVQHPRASLLLALEALTDQRSLKALGAATTVERAKQFLLSAHLNDELRVSTASRLRAALAASASLAGMIGAPSCIQFSTLTAPGSIVLADLGRPIGGLTGLQTFYANLVVRLAVEHLMERPSPWPGHHCRIVVDEAQIVAPVLSDRAEAILTTGRSRGLSLTTITQGTTLLAAASDTLLRVLMTNTATRFVGRLAAPDAEMLAREQAPARGVDESISSFRSRFTAAVTSLEDREFFCLTPGRRERFRTALVDMDAWRAAGERNAALVEAVKSRLAIPRNTVPALRLAGLASSAARGPSSSITIINTTSTSGNRRRSSATPVRPRSRWG